MNRRAFLKRAFAAAAVPPALGLAYGYLEARWLVVDRQTVTVPRLPAPFEGKTVAVVADVHHSHLVPLDYVNAVVDATNALKPDLVALPGDFVHEHAEHAYTRPCIEALARLRAPLGVYAVPGNHDHWDNVGLLHRCLREYGITDLTNAGTGVECGRARMRVGGVDDFWEGDRDLDAALGDARAGDCCLLLSHNPDFVERLRDRRVGLVLSGHMHGGQVVLPGVGYRRLPSLYGKKYLEGLVQTPHTQVFVSRGVGVTGVPLRFRCPPEINLLTLTAG